MTNFSTLWGMTVIRKTLQISFAILFSGMMAFADVVDPGGKDGENDTYTTILDFREKSQRELNSPSAVFPTVRLLFAPSVYTYYNCQQKCGLTSNTGTYVTFPSIDRYAFLGALRTFCQNQKMQLQGDVVCTESRIDNTSSEYFQRCAKGIAVTSCRVSVSGYGWNSTTFGNFYGASTRSFDEAEASAMDQCRKNYGYYATCVVSGYSAQ